MTQGTGGTPPDSTASAVADATPAIGTLPPVNLDQVDRLVPVRDEPSLTIIGFNLAIALLGLVAAVLVGIGIFGWLTYPTPSAIGGIVSDPTKRFDDYQQAQTAWFGTIKDLIQLLVVSLLVPLLATVIGYIFGRQQPRRLE